MLRRLLICGAFATWTFVNTWVELAQGQAPYFAKYDPRFTSALPAAVCAAVLALAMLGAWEWFRGRPHGRLPHYLFLAACAAPAGVAAVALLRLLPIRVLPLVWSRYFWPCALAAAVVPAILVLRWPERASRAVREALLYSWPVLLVILVQAARLGLCYSGAEFADGPFAAKLPGAPPVRVVWILFDETSRRIAFDERPAGLELPHFDRLRAESIYARAAHPPADATGSCIPSLILGEAVTEAEPAGPAQLRMRSAARHGTFGWDRHPNVFDAARAMGLNAAVAGWFHPYGRILNRSVTEAYWIAGELNAGAEEPARPQPLAANIAFRLRMQWNGFPLVGRIPGVFPGLEGRRQTIERLEYLVNRAGRLASDPTIGLALLHVQPPHPPAVFDRRSASLAPERRENSYLDSLAFADRILGRLRRQMEEAGVWDRTAVIVSADHGWRAAIWRGGPGWTAEDESTPREETTEVPFLVKTPGHGAPLEYAEPFNTVATRALVERILAGKVTTAADVADAISARPAR
jgi:hypothetical protein